MLTDAQKAMVAYMAEAPGTRREKFGYVVFLIKTLGGERHVQSIPAQYQDAFRTCLAHALKRELRNAA